MATVTVRIDGLSDLLANMRDLDKKVKRKFIRSAALAGANEIKKAAIARAPVKTGELKASISTRRSRKFSNTEQGYEQRDVGVFKVKGGKFRNTARNRRLGRVGTDHGKGSALLLLAVPGIRNGPHAAASVPAAWIRRIQECCRRSHDCEAAQGYRRLQEMIEGIVHTALKGLVNGHCYASVFPQPDSGTLPIWPAIRYTIVSRVNPADICGTDDLDTDDTRVQLDCVSLTHGGMLTLQDQVISAMMGLSPPAVRDGGFNTYDEETKTHRAVLDFLFCGSSAGSP